MYDPEYFLDDPGHFSGESDYLGTELDNLLDTFEDIFYEECETKLYIDNEMNHDNQTENDREGVENDGESDTGGDDSAVQDLTEGDESKTEGEDTEDEKDSEEEGTEYFETWRCISRPRQGCQIPV